MARRMLEGEKIEDPSNDTVGAMEGKFSVHRRGNNERGGGGERQDRAGEVRKKKRHKVESARERGMS